MSRSRLDTELVRRGLVPDIEDAAAQIRGRRILVDGAPALKPGTLVERSAQIVMASPPKYVSRGGTKLAGALEDLDVDVVGLRCCDIGAGSGGFTDVLLQAGASEVVAIDVGYGQFDWGLRNDPRVILMERTNVRTMDLGAVGSVDLVVADLSFISIRGVAGTIDKIAGSGGALLLMVKPQFEAPREMVGPGGVITDPEVHRSTVDSVVAVFVEKGFRFEGSAPSRLKGAEGNQEFFVYLRSEDR